MGWNQNVYTSNSICTSFFLNHLLTDSFQPHLIPMMWVSNRGSADVTTFHFACGSTSMKVGPYSYLQGRRKKEDGFKIIATIFVTDSFSIFLLNTYVKVTGDKVVNQTDMVLALKELTV